MAHSFDKQRMIKEDLRRTRAAQAVIDLQTPGKSSPIDTLSELEQLLKNNQSQGKTPIPSNTNLNIENVNGPISKR